MKSRLAAFSAALDELDVVGELRMDEAVEQSGVQTKNVIRVATLNKRVSAGE